MLTIEEILIATKGTLLEGNPALEAKGISTDSRTIRQKELFVALKGKNFDGQSFIEEAIKKGSIGAVISDSPCPAPPEKDFVYIQVQDTLKAYGDIAHFYRKKFDISVIGITGSNGKTTTKDMVAEVLSARFNPLKNEGTQNNLIGLPRTIFKLRPSHKIAIFEMGMNHLGEIRRLAQISQPQVGIITNIGPSHLEFLGSLEAVLAAKCELIDQLPPEGLVIINSDDTMLSKLKKFPCRKVGVGLNPGADFRATNIEQFYGGSRFLLNGKFEFKMRILGLHNIFNALCAIAAGENFKIDIKDMQNMLYNFKSPSMRMEIKRVEKITFIDDSYNSNPQSMKCAIWVLSNFKTKGKRILVCADMLELGEASSYYHRKVGELIAESGIDILISVGEMAVEFANGALSSGMAKDSVYCLKSNKGAARLLSRIIKGGDTVLVKGSRATKTEEIIEQCSTTYFTH